MAKSASPPRVRQQPPELRCWTLTGLIVLSAFMQPGERVSSDPAVMQPPQLSHTSLRCRLFPGSAVPDAPHAEPPQ